MDVTIRPDQPAKVTGQGTEDKILQPGQTHTFTGVEGLNVELADPSELEIPPTTDDVWSPGNRPNGFMSAGIAPKMPKSSGELVQHPVGPNAVIERAAAELGQATQGGGPDSEVGQGEFRTPGPQPDQTGEGVGVAAQQGAAAGDTDQRGRPVQREESRKGDAPKDQKGKK